jgi:hypothetical protein
MRAPYRRHRAIGSGFHAPDTLTPYHRVLTPYRRVLTPYRKYSLRSTPRALLSKLESPNAPLPRCRPSVTRTLEPDSGWATRPVARGPAGAFCVMCDAGSFCYTRNAPDVKPLLSHGGLECIAAVIDLHMRHQGAPSRACAAGLLVCLFVCLFVRLFVCLFAKCGDATGSPTRRAECNGPSTYRVMFFRFALDRCAARPPTALQECCGWR